MADTNGGGINWLVDLVVKPGTSVRLVPAINVVLVLLVLVLLALAVSGVGSVHVYVMGFLSLGLMASVNWFMAEYQKVKAQQDGTEGDTKTTPGAADAGAPPREKAD